MTYSEAVAKFYAGENFDATTTFDVGSRAGERDGYRVEGDTLIQFGPAEWVDGRIPAGTRKNIIAKREPAQ